MSNPTHCNTLFKLNSRCHLAILALLAAMVAQAVYSEALNGKHYFDIPAQSLNQALLTFGKQSHRQLMYSTDIAENQRSQTLKGDYTSTEAISILLHNSPLQAVTTAEGTLTLRHKPTANPLVPVANPRTTEPMSETTLEKVTVEADADNPYDDPTWQTDPYNTDYVLPKATAGTKTNTPVMETPMNVQVISKQVLKDQQVISLDKALRNVSGVTTTSASSSFEGQQLFLRGFQTQALFRNGFRMDASDQAFGNSQQQFANVESVEVLKGPAAILYGRVEPGGMVNITTKQPRATPYYSLNQQFGSYDLYRTSIDATGPLTKDDTLLYRMNASFQSNNSFRNLVSGEDIFLAPIVKWNISPRTQATLEMEYNRSLSSADNTMLPFNETTQRFTNAPHSRNFGGRNPLETENIFVGLNWSHQFNDDWSIKHQAFFKQQNFKTGVSIFPYNFRPLDKEWDAVGAISQVTNETVATNLDLTGHFKTWGLEHTLLFGGDYYRFDSFLDQINGSTPFSISLDNPIPPSNVVVDRSGEFKFRAITDNYGLYAQDQIKLPYDLHVMGGLRYQYVHRTTANADASGVFIPDIPLTDDAVTPRVGLLWSPKKWLSLYSNYAENFGANTGVAFGLKPLPSSSAQQWEVGAKTELFDGRFRATLAYYDLTKQNAPTADFTPGHICFGGGPGSCEIAVGEVRSRGPELDIQGEILPGWNMIATYANQDVRVTKSKDTAASGGTFLVGNRLQFTPRNIGSFWSTYEVQHGELKGFKFGGGVTLQDGVVNDANTFKSTGYALVGLLAGYSFEVDKAKITAQLNIDNLLDKSYFTNAAPQLGSNYGYVNFSTPRTFMGSINVQY